jgi:hypothetical protein
MSNAISKVLIAFFLCFTYPTETYSLNLSASSISSSSSEACKPVKPVKSKKKKTKGHKQKRVQYDEFWIFTALFCFGILAYIAGLTFFIIGLFTANFLMWLIGLCTFSILYLMLSYTIITSIIYGEYEDTPLGGVIEALALLYKLLFDFALSVSLIILGLIFALPVFWIVGLSLFVLAIATIILMIILAN